MSVDAAPQERAAFVDPDADPRSDVPKQPPAVGGVDVALVRDGRIAVLHTLVLRT